MFVGNELSGKLPRDQGQWGLTVVVTESNYGEKTERTIKDEKGEIEMGKDVRESANTAVVGTSRGMTLNMGNFCSARIDVWASIPTDPNAMDEAYDVVKGFCEEKIEQGINEVKNAE